MAAVVEGISQRDQLFHLPPLILRALRHRFTHNFQSSSKTEMPALASRVFPEPVFGMAQKVIRFEEMLDRRSAIRLLRYPSSPASAKDRLSSWLLCLGLVSDSREISGLLQSYAALWCQPAPRPHARRVGPPPVQSGSLSELVRVALSEGDGFG
jgi:hypothetical protein